MVEITMPNRYTGRLFDVIHGVDDMQNGEIVALDGMNADNFGCYDAKDPATADLDDTSYYMINQSESNPTGTEKVSAFTIKSGTPATAYPLVQDATVNIPARLITGTPANGGYLIPADGTRLLATASDLTDGTKLALEVVNASEFILEDGDRVASVLARVIQG